ncbi:GCN5 family acetyltransferase [Paenibacillus oryzae]|uniref:GCN5 family acetyltransferase n=1 Tax=Paenibacillus oryzae TaxID=1844972 RepID=A0A1A5YLN0_9BACL|nr:GNAT family protein [Paenibacillus oryzae]OBR66522.1 GCN5 family acetyltransferase [Paenibacillus oryzae]
MKIEGEKVRLSKIDENNLSFVSELECNSMVWQYEESVEKDKEAARSKYREQMNSQYHYDFVITKESNDSESTDLESPIGIVQAWSYVEHRHSWELGFGMLADYQGKGYGYEAVQLLLQYMFETTNARKIVGMCNSKNVKSIKLMEKLNMTREGIFKEEFLWNGNYCDQYFYSILKKEWQSANKGG